MKRLLCLFGLTLAAALAAASVPGWQIDVAMLLLLAIDCVYMQR